MASVKRARDYGKAILIHSLRSWKDSLYPGQHYSNLANLLRENLEAKESDNSTAAPADEHSDILATLYDLKLQNPEQTSPVECIKFRKNEAARLQAWPEPNEPTGQVLFLRGHLTAEWIKTVGAKYRIDPEFFQRHLSFQSAPIHTTVFALPSLPSTTRNIIRLNISTICCHDSAITTSSRGTFQDIQDEQADAMSRYFRQFGCSAKPGDSVVRAYTTVTERFSVIEQDISICLEQNGKGWVAILWLDNGRSLDESPAGPWLPLGASGDVGMTLFPVQQHLKHVALKYMMSVNAEFSPGNTTDGDPLPRQPYCQSASLVPLEYGRFLDHEVAKSDFLFAVADIFRFAAFSEVQCLNLLQISIDDIVRQRRGERTVSSTAAVADPIEALLEYKTLLERHHLRLQETLATVRRRAKSGWPKADKDTSRQKASLAACRLEEDYAHLLARTKELAVACNEGMGMLMNVAVIQEAKKAMAQTERVKKLTLLATFFIPLSFTSSVFGMNLQELNSSRLSIWVWVSITVPVLLLTLVTYMCNFGDLKARVAQMKRARHAARLEAMAEKLARD